MTKSRFSEVQIISVLREQKAGGATVEVCRRHGISEQTFYRWKAKYSGMSVSDGHPEAEDAGGREPAAEEAAGGVDAGRGGAEGSPGKN